MSVGSSFGSGDFLLGLLLFIVGVGSVDSSISILGVDSRVPIDQFLNRPPSQPMTRFERLHDVVANAFGDRHNSIADGLNILSMK